MPIHDIQCGKCDNVRVFRFSVNDEDIEGNVKRTVCEECGHTGHHIVWGNVRQGIDMVFEPGFYNIGVPSRDIRGKWYDTKRQMLNDAARNGIVPRRD